MFVVLLFFCSRQEKTNEDSQMVAGGDSTVGAGCGRRQRETQQGGIQGAAAISTSREIPTQGIDRSPFSFASCNKRAVMLYTHMETIMLELSARIR